MRTIEDTETHRLLKEYDCWRISKAIDVARILEGTNNKSTIRTAPSAESYSQSTPESILLCFAKIDLCYIVN